MALGKILEDLAGEAAEAVGAHVTVDGEGGGADEGGQLSRGEAAGEIHLEEALLGVEIALGADGVLEGFGPDARDAEGIALDGDGGREASERDLALESGERGDEREPDGEDEQEEGCNEDARADEEAAAPAACSRAFGGVEIGFVRFAMHGSGGSSASERRMTGRAGGSYAGRLGWVGGRKSSLPERSRGYGRPHGVVTDSDPGAQ